jgi:hypothetical protein
MENKDMKYKRLQFDFSTEAVNRLDNIKDATNSASRAEVLRNSLRVYEYFYNMLKEGYEIKLKKDEKEVTVAPLPI